MPKKSRFAYRLILFFELVLLATPVLLQVLTPFKLAPLFASLGAVSLPGLAFSSPILAAVILGLLLGILFMGPINLLKPSLNRSSLFSKVIAHAFKPLINLGRHAVKVLCSKVGMSIRSFYRGARIVLSVASLGGVCAVLWISGVLPFVAVLLAAALPGLGVTGAVACLSVGLAVGCVAYLLVAIGQFSRFPVYHIRNQVEDVSISKIKYTPIAGQNQATTYNHMTNIALISTDQSSLILCDKGTESRSQSQSMVESDYLQKIPME